MSDDLQGALTSVREGLAGLGLADAVFFGREGDLGDQRDFALIAFDADSVQAQVFASPRPVTIQGASVILRAWDDDLGKGKILGDDAVVLFAGGGQAVALALRDKIDGVCRKLRGEFRERTGGSPCTVAHVEVSARELARGPQRATREIPSSLARRIGWSSSGSRRGFGDCMALLSLAMRAAKGEASAHAFLDAESPSARCKECAERPRLTGNNLCARCAKNHARGGEDKREWDRAHSFDEVLGKQTKRADDEGDEQPPRARHLAFLKIDGRGIGAELEKLRTMAQYVALSRALKRAFEHRSLADFGVPEGRYQIPIAGGDDLLLVVPARWNPQAEGGTADAFSLTAKLLEHAERAFDELAKHELFADIQGIRTLGAGAGLVITSGLPASFCFDYAGDLVKSAKDGIGEHDRSALDFAVVRGGTPLSSSLRDLRRRELMALDLGAELTGPVQPTRCPYVLDDLRELIDRAGRLASAPRSALHALHAAMRDPTTGLLAVRYQLARHAELRRALADEVPLAELPPSLGRWVLHKLEPRAAGDPKWATPLGDLLDLLPFVEAER